MNAITVQTTPFDGQKPGTSGLRKKTSVFLEPHYLENFVEATWTAIGGAAGKTFVLGGDGRYLNDRAAQVILRMAAASGAVRVIVGRDALLSTPAASHLIRSRGADGGIILSASHNPGGPDEDFGVKYNTSNGGPAPQDVTDAIHAASRTIDAYRIIDAPEVDLSRTGETMLGDMTVEVVDSVEDYAELMSGLFDFDAIARHLADGFTLRFDAMTKTLTHYDTTIDPNTGYPLASNHEPTQLNYDQTTPLDAQLNAFVNAIQTRRPPITSGESALAVIQVLEALSKSDDIADKLLHSLESNSGNSKGYTWRREDAYEGRI